MENKFSKTHIFRDLPLSWKFSSIVCGVIVMIGIVFLIFIESRVTNILDAEHEERGMTIARYLAADCVDLLLTNNRIKLHQLLSNIKDIEKDVEYIFVLDSEKNIVAHTFGNKGFPEVLLSATAIHGGAQTSAIHLGFDSSEKIIYDIDVLAMEGEAGEIHIGLSEVFIQQKIQNLKLELLGITSIVCLLGFFAAFFFAKIINKPLKTLSIANDTFGQGERVPALPITANDEIGRLTATFNQMVSKIERSRTKQKKVEAALRLSKKDWERTFNAISDIVTLQTPNMCIIKMNTSGCATLEIPWKEIKGQHCYELFHGSTAPCHECPLLKMKKTLSSCTKEIHYKKLGKTYLVSASPVINEVGKLTHIVHVATDITAIKKSEEDRIRLAAAIDQSSETVVITDVEGSIQYVNPAFERLTSYSREEAIGQNPRILKSGRHAPVFYKKMWATLLQGNTWKGHLINKKKDGTLFEEEATISPVKNSEGQITNFVAVKRDVSREVLLEKQLRQVMKMEAIGTLAGGIAHDFNNILAAILGYSEIVRAQLPDNGQIRKDIDQVICAGNRAADLVRQILTFSRHTKEEFKPLKIQLIIQEVLNLIRSSLPTTIHLKENIAAANGLILADSTLIHQVLMNLCTNAKHAIGEAIGTLSVSLSEVQVTGSDIIADCPQLGHGTYLDLEISDTGCGMDGLTQTKIFDPFFTTKEKGKGTGLGLAVVHGIIKQHKGEITVSSEPGQGTTFHIYLPITDREMQTEQLAIEHIQRGRERILLVDDEAALAHMIQRSLQNLGYTVTVFTSSIDALDAYTKNPDDFDLVITDMTIPEMTGATLAEKLLTFRPELPVIMCTGFSESIDAEKANSLGICDYIIKPVNIYTLAKAIRKALMPT